MSHPSEPVIEPAHEHGAAPCVLVVEDHEIVREMCTAALDSFGYDVVAVADAPAALDVAATRSGIVAVLTDVALPDGQSGVQLVEQLRQLHPQLAVIVMTGRPDSAAGLDPATTQLLAKPFTMNELDDALRAALGEP